MKGARGQVSRRFLQPIRLLHSSEHGSALPPPYTISGACLPVEGNANPELCLLMADDLECMMQADKCVWDGKSLHEARCGPCSLAASRTQWGGGEGGYGNCTCLDLFSHLTFPLPPPPLSPSCRGPLSRYLSRGAAGYCIYRRFPGPCQQQQH